MTYHHFHCIQLLSWSTGCLHQLRHTMPACISSWLTILSWTPSSHPHPTRLNWCLHVVQPIARSSGSVVKVIVDGQVSSMLEPADNSSSRSELVTQLTPSTAALIDCQHHEMIWLTYRTSEIESYAHDGQSKTYVFLDSVAPESRRCPRSITNLVEMDDFER